MNANAQDQPDERIVALCDVITDTGLDYGKDINDTVFRLVRACKSQFDDLSLAEFWEALEAVCIAHTLDEERIEEFQAVTILRFDSISKASVLDLARGLIERHEARVQLEDVDVPIIPSMATRMIEVATLIFHLQELSSVEVFLSCRDCGKFSGVSHMQANTDLRLMAKIGYLEKVGEATGDDAQCWKLGPRTVVKESLRTLHTNTHTHKHTDSQTHPPPPKEGCGDVVIPENPSTNGPTSIANILPFTPITRTIRERSINSPQPREQNKDSAAMFTYTCCNCKQDFQMATAPVANTEYRCSGCLSYMGLPQGERNRQVLLQVHKEELEQTKSERKARVAVCQKVADLLNLPLRSTVDQLMHLFEAHGYKTVMGELLDVMPDSQVRAPIAVVKSRLNLQ